jgi:hypothetical protein
MGPKFRWGIKEALESWFGLDRGYVSELMGMKARPSIFPLLRKFNERTE